MSILHPDPNEYHRSRDQNGAATLYGATSVALTKTDRLQLLVMLGTLVTLLALGAPTGSLFDVALSLLLKNKLHISPNEMSSFKAVLSLPVYFSPLFGLIRDSWNPMRMGDRGYITIFGAATALSYLLLSFVTMGYIELLIVILTLNILFRLVSSAESSIIAQLGRDNVISGQVSVIWNASISIMAAFGVILGSWLSGILERLDTQRAFQTLFLSCAITLLLPVIIMYYQRRGILWKYRTDKDELISTYSKLRQLSKNRTVYLTLAIIVLWNFSPGIETPLLFHFQEDLHGSDAQWGVWNAICSISFIPAFLIFGALCTRVSLRKILFWATILGIPQMVPLLFTRSISDANWAAASIGFMGGAATAAYMALLIRSCPAGLQGTVLMAAVALDVASSKIGDLLSTRLYELFGGFEICVFATTFTYAMILPLLFVLPRDLIDTLDR